MNAKPIMGLLFLLVFASALSVVYVRHESRNLFTAIQQLEMKRDNMNVEWGRLQLEQSTYATHVRVERVATQELNMWLPKLSDIKMVRP